MGIGISGQLKRQNSKFKMWHLTSVNQQQHNRTESIMENTETKQKLAVATQAQVDAAFLDLLRQHRRGCSRSRVDRRIKWTRG